MNKYLMNTFSKRRGTALVASLSVLLLAGCIQPADIEEVNKGEVSFGVTAAYQADIRTRSTSDEIQTRTEYSGKDENDEDVNSDSSSERIDWLSSDDITILCQQAEGDKTANFSVTPTGHTVNTTISKATIDPIDHKLYWGASGTHYFFGLYPSPLMDGAPSGVNIATSGSNGTAATITGTIPTTQTVTVDGTELKPNMAYAYMYAAAQASSGDVDLHFKPLVTTLRFTLKSQTSFPAGLTLTKIELSSTQTNGSYLAGDFTATITDNGYNPATGLSVANNANRSNTITINVPSGVTLNTDDVLMFTVLTLPMEQTAMKLTLTFSDGSSKTLNLKFKDTDNVVKLITVGATKKCYINDVGLPWLYYLDVTPTITSDYLGKTTTYTVTSYKYISGSGTKYGTRWDAISYAVNGGTATTTKPAWLPTFKQANTPASGDPVNHNVVIAPADRHNPGIEALENADPRGTATNPWDLSTHNINGGSISKTTANCYVITAPGWYKFPLAYGNAYKDGNRNTAAYNNTLPSGTTQNPHYLKPFKDANNNNITSADISGINGVQLVWQDAQNLITVADLKVENGYVVFHVEKENIREGNAVIAARKGNTIFWSWHIWVTPYVKNDVTLKGQTYMARNLGWCEGGVTTWQPRNVVITFRQPENPSVTKTLTITQTGHEETVLGSGPHYQWGRKDPMIPPIGLSGATQFAANKIWYNASGVASQNVVTKEGPQTLGYAMQNPMTMIYLPRERLPRSISGIGNAGDGFWFGDYIGPKDTWESNEHYCNLWNYNVNKNGTYNTSLLVKDFVGLAHGKTVYDPCPIGYTIPTPYELANLATFKTGSWLNDYTLYNSNPGTYTSDGTMVGYNISGNFWPANGMRMYLSSETHVANVGQYGYWFSSAPSHSHYALLLLEYTPGYELSGNAGFTMDGSWAKGSGRSLRCVPE